MATVDALRHAPAVALVGPAAALAGVLAVVPAPGPVAVGPAASMAASAAMVGAVARPRWRRVRSAKRHARLGQ